MTWRELHDLAVEMMSRFEALPVRQQAIYKETGRLE